MRPILDESGIVVVMHHNDNLSPLKQAARVFLIRAAVAVAVLVVIALTLAWLAFIFHAVQVFTAVMALAAEHAIHFVGQLLQ